MENSTNPQTPNANLASLADRFLGAVVDWLVFGALYYVIDVFLGRSIGYLTGALYLLIRDALPFLDGQSIGKKVMKTRAVKEDSGAPLTNDYATALVRNIPAAIPLLSFVDGIFIFFGDERKRLGDKIGKTIVIKE